MKYYVFPSDKKGKIIKGFCPRECSSESVAQYEATCMALNYGISGIKFHHIELQKIN